MSNRSPLLTPEVVDAIARNAEALNTAMNNKSETAALGQKHHGPVGGDHAVAPKFIKFKFILCDVECNNVNAVAAEEDQTPPWKPGRPAR